MPRNSSTKRNRIARRSSVFIRRIQARLIFWGGAIAVGLIAVLFTDLTHWMVNLFNRELYYRPWVPFVITPLSGIVIMWMTKRWFSGIEGSGIPQIMAEMERGRNEKWPGFVSLRLAAGKIGLGSAAIGSGFSFGSEGPMVQIGASIMASIKRYLPRSSEITQRHLLVVGASAGISAAFNTPLAGIIFAIEELNRGIESRMNGLIITGIVLAGIVARSLVGNQSFFGQVLITGSYQTIVQIVLLSAIATGIMGGIFAKVIDSAAANWNTPMGRFRAAHPYQFAGLCGLLLAAIGYTQGGMTYGTGLAETIRLLEGEMEVAWHFGPAKFIATLIASISGLPGGTFAPSLAIGAGIGHDLYLLIGEDAPSGMLLAFCMAGFLAAVTQAPITAFVIVMEMVDGYRMVIGLMVTALMASGIAKMIAPPLYPFLMDKILKKKRAEEAAAAQAPASS